jgi:hypothetical protein
MISICCQKEHYGEELLSHCVPFPFSPTGFVLKGNATFTFGFGGRECTTVGGGVSSSSPSSGESVNCRFEPLASGDLEAERLCWTIDPAVKVKSQPGPAFISQFNILSHQFQFKNAKCP